MSDAEVKDLNQISKKDIYHTPSGKYIQFIHDHSEKTFDAWELLPDCLLYTSPSPRDS